MTRVTPVLTPVFEIVIVPAVVEPPEVASCTSSTRTPPPAEAGTKLVTPVTFHVPLATTVAIGLPGPDGELNRVNRPLPVTCPAEPGVPEPLSNNQSLPDA